MTERESDPSEPHQAEHRLDEKVKIPLPFEKAVRGLLATEPPENGKRSKQPAKRAKR